MSSLELQGEMQNPGKVGKVAVGEEHEACQWRGLVWARFVFVIVGLPVAWFLAVPHVPLPTWQAWAADERGRVEPTVAGWVSRPAGGTP